MTVNGSDTGASTSTGTVNKGLAQMLKGGVIMDVVTPSRPGSLRRRAQSPSWPWNAFPPTSAQRAAWPA